MKQMQELVDLIRRAERRAEALTIVSLSLEEIPIHDAEGRGVRAAMLGAAEALVDAVFGVVSWAEAELDNGLEGQCPD